MSLSRKPELVLVNPPETKIRFRYLSEGGSHGGLIGKDKSNGKKSFPTVKLNNYHGKKRVYVRVRLFTEDKKEHVLEFREKKAGVAVPHLTEYIKEDGTAMFPDLKILSKKKDEIEKLLMDRKIKNLKDVITPCVRAQFEKTYSKEVKARAKAILNSVRLKFEAFEEDNSPLCSLFSEIICNQKAASKGDLKIHRISAVAGDWKGGDEIILLCDKVQKENIKVRFYEMDDDEVTWEGYGEFSRADVHYQVAITFKTPPYKENAEKTVFLCLERNGEMSETRTFTYRAEDVHYSKKRKYCPDSNAYPREYAPQEFEDSMLMYSPQSSSNDSPWKTNSNVCKNFISDDMYSPNGPESSPEVSDKAMDMSEESSTEEPLPENPFSEFNLGLQEFTDLVQELCPTNMELFPDLFEVSQYEEDRPVQCDAIDGVDGRLPVMRICTEYDGVKSEKYSIKKRCKIGELSEKYHHNAEKIRKLLSMRDSFGNTFLHVATRANRNIANIIAVGLIANCNIVNEQNHQKQTALHIAIEQDDNRAVAMLLRIGADPNIKDIDGNNCLHIAAHHDSFLSLRCIIFESRIRSDANAFNYAGFTPLHIALLRNSRGCFHLLLMRANTRLVEQKCCKSLLHLAVQCQPSFVPELLRRKEIDVNVQDSEGNTPLHLACALENIDVVKELLLAGADPSVKNFKQKYDDLTQSKEDTPDEQKQADMASNIVRNDEDTSDGETPADMTSNCEIQEILNNTAKAKFGSSENLQTVKESISTETLNKLCAYLDTNDRWKLVSTYFVEDIYSGSLECSESPTKALLTYIKKEHQGSYIEQFKEVLKLIELTEAVKIIDEGYF